MSSIFAHTLSVPADDILSPPLDAPTTPQDALTPDELPLAPSSDDLVPRDALASDAPAEASAAVLSPKTVSYAATPHEMVVPSSADAMSQPVAPQVQAIEVIPTSTLAGNLGAVLLLGGFMAFGLLTSRTPNAAKTSTPKRALSRSTPQNNTTTPDANLSSGMTGQAGQPFSLPLLGVNPQAPLDLKPQSSLSSGTTPGAPAVLPQSPAARLFAQAIELQKRGKIDEAATAYRAVTKLQPKAAAAWINLAILLLQNKQSAQAIEPLRRATQLEPKNPAPLQQLVRTLLGLKRASEALPPLRQLAELQPKDVATHTMLAQMLQQSGKSREAYDQWVLLTSLDANNPIPPFWAGMIAAKALNQPANAETYLRRSFDLQSQPGQKITDPRAALFLTQVLTARKKVPEAIKVCEAGIKQFPQVLELRTQLADVRLAAQDLPGAIRATRDALTVVPAQAPNELKARLHAGLGQMLLTNQQIKEGIVELRTASQLVPQNQKLAALLKTVEAQSKSVPNQPALTDANAALLKKARDLGRAGKWGAAAQAYASYNAAQKNDAGGLAEYAFAQEQRKAWPEAEQLWAQVATLQPKSPLPPLHRYEALRRLKRTADALAAIRRAHALAPNDPDILLRAADAEALAQNFSVAREHMQTLLTLQPDFVQGYGALAEVAVRGKDIKPAVDFLQKQITKHPNHTEAYEAILEAYDGVGQTKQGREVVKAWIERDKKNKAPRTALDNFDVFKARQELAEGVRKDRERLKNQRPAGTETSPKAPDAASTTKPDVVAPEKPLEGKPATSPEKQP